MAYQFDGIFLLKRRDHSKGVDHYAVGIGGGYAWRANFACPVILELAPTGVRVRPWLATEGWQIGERAADPEATLGRVLRAQRGAYDLLANNCEHFARLVVSGRKESSQVRDGTAIVGLALLAAWAFAPRRALGCRDR